MEMVARRIYQFLLRPTLLSSTPLFHQWINLGERSDHFLWESHVIINWFNEASLFHFHTLRPILHEFLLIKNNFDFISFHHIYGAHKSIVDALSKEGVQQVWGS